MRTTARGFTLIELSIVLVIIGLIVGGVLVGQNLIVAAGVRATIAQIEKYNTAVNTFRGKYGGLPGDLPNPYATQFGFSSRGTQPGEGDGNGVIEGNDWFESGSFSGFEERVGETTVFWVDLSTANLIDGGFNTAQEVTANGGTMDALFPQAKIGGGNYIYVWSGGIIGGDGINYFGLAAVQSVGGGSMAATTGLTVQQAFSIDTKMDDGMPQSGNVTAMFIGCSSPGWAAAGAPCTSSGDHGVNDAPTTGPSPYSIINCYDNNNTNNTPETYSLALNASQVNCGLSFRFQ